jgi:uncharacterized protein YecT (DUF1311 family)
MKLVQILMVLSCGLSMTFNAQAASQTTKLDKIYGHCLEKSGPINNGVVEGCSNMASHEAKKQITLYYNQMYNRLIKEAPEDAKKLEEAQKSWIVYRDKHCALMGSYVGSPMYSYCPMQLNITRADELRELAH